MEFLCFYSSLRFVVPPPHYKGGEQKYRGLKNGIWNNSSETALTLIESESIQNKNVIPGDTHKIFDLVILRFLNVSCLSFWTENVLKVF